MDEKTTSEIVAFLAQVTEGTNSSKNLKYELINTQDVCHGVIVIQK